MKSKDLPAVHGGAAVTFLGVKRDEHKITI